MRTFGESYHRETRRDRDEAPWYPMDTVRGISRYHPLKQAKQKKTQLGNSTISKFIVPLDPCLSCSLCQCSPSSTISSSNSDLSRVFSATDVVSSAFSSSSLQSIVDHHALSPIWSSRSQKNATTVNSSIAVVIAIIARLAMQASCCYSVQDSPVIT